MDIFQRFKNFLGLSSKTNSGPSDSQQSLRDLQSFWDSHEDNRIEHPERSPNTHDSFGFNVFTNPLEMHRYFEHHMNEMLKNFGVFTNDDSFFDKFGNNAHPFFGDNPFGHNGLESHQFPSSDDFNKENSLNSGTLRDQYLKPGYEASPSGQAKIDKDVDEKFAMNELDTVFKNAPPQVQPKSFFYGQSVTTKTIRNQDGTVESHRTVRDQNGNEETTVTKRQGDKEYTVTTKRNKNGAQEVIENMVNLDDNDKEKFLKKGLQTITDHDLNTSGDFPYNKFF